jgi:hypothetical protein
MARTGRAGRIRGVEAEAMRAIAWIWFAAVVLVYWLPWLVTP